MDARAFPVYRGASRSAHIRRGAIKLKCANVSVTDFNRSLDFYQTTLGLPLLSADPKFGYASFAAGTASLAIVRDTEGTRVGRHTGIGLCVADLDVAYTRLAAAGVLFTMQPSQQPWGGYMSMFADPDGNVFYLDQEPD